MNTAVTITAIICMTLLLICLINKNDKKGGDNNGNP